MADKKDNKINKNEKPAPIDASTEKSQNPEKVSKKRRIILFIGITSITLLALAGGSFFAIKTFSSKSTTNNSNLPVSPVSVTTTVQQSKDAHGNEKADKDATATDKTNKDATATEKATENKKEKTDEHETENKDKILGIGEPPKIGEFFAINRIEVNLANPIENRYLRLGVSIEYKGSKDQLEELKKREPQIKDIIISVASAKSRLDILAEGAKNKLRKEILNKINEVTEKPVSSVYFTDFLVE